MYVIRIECPDGPVVGPGEMLSLVSEKVYEYFSFLEPAVTAGRIKIQWTDSPYEEPTTKGAAHE